MCEWVIARHQANVGTNNNCHQVNVLMITEFWIKLYSRSTHRNAFQKIVCHYYDIMIAGDFLYSYFWYRLFYAQIYKYNIKYC